MTERRLERMDHFSKLDMCSHKAGTGVRDQGACLFCEGPGLYYLFVYLSTGWSTGLKGLRSLEAKKQEGNYP